MADGHKTFEAQGFEILVGQGDRANDRLTFKLAAPRDFWLHAAGVPGSHVVVRNPENLPELPKAVAERAAELAVKHSKAKSAGGKVPVHLCRVADVSKPRRAAAGKVRLRRFDEIKVYGKD